MTAAARLTCSGCGASVVVPPDHVRAKVRCSGCGYYVEVPPALRAAVQAKPPLGPAADQPPPRAAAQATEPPFELLTEPPAEPHAEPHTESVTRPRTEPPSRLRSKAPTRPRSEPSSESHAEPPTEPHGRLRSKAPTRPPPLVAGTQDEEDGRPYTVPGDPVKKCPECWKEIDWDATFCIHCGTELATGRKADRTFEAFDRLWEPRWNFAVRWKVFLGLQVLNLLLAGTAVMAGSSISSMLTFLAMQSGLQAFLLGTYKAVAVKRTRKGAASIEHIWRVCFVQRPPTEVNWKQSSGVGIIAIHQPGLLEWFTMISLLLSGILPGVLFYWFVIRPERFQVALCDEYGSTNEVIYRATDREQAEDICQSIRDAAGLWYRPVM